MAKHGSANRPLGKKIPQQMLTGQEGINLIARRVTDMGFIWNQHGGLDFGIDGHLELRDPNSGEALNSIVLVQSKATHGAFLNETAESLEYHCEERDLRYWLQGNAPVILICSRPTSDEAYWVPVKEYFSTPKRIAARRVRFSKSADAFDLSARDRLLSIGLRKDYGIYLAPARRRERLYSNLLQVERFAPHLYRARAVANSTEEIRTRLHEEELYPSREWRLSAGHILSTQDLRNNPWTAVTEGSVDVLSTEDWANSDDPVDRHDFVQLLNRWLEGQLAKVGIRYDRVDRYFFVRATPDLTTRKVHYVSLQKQTSREVFSRYDYADGSPHYYRHSAFYGHFCRFGARWFLEITPTYRFTTDGRVIHPAYEPKLKGIKALEKNESVLGQVWMWGMQLRSRPRDLFSEEEFVTFGQLLSFDSEVAIDDKLWLGSEDEDQDDSEPLDEAEEQERPLPLFAASDDP